MSKVRQKIVIIGATSAIAEHCARLWVTAASVDLILVVRDVAKAQRLAQDLQVRSPHSSIDVRQVDFIDPLAILQLVNTLYSEGAVDTVLIAHGTLPDQAMLQLDLSACAETLQINGISPVLFAEAFAGQMQQANSGTLALISSVAGDRGRKSNYVYGSAKGLVTRYAQGLQHRLAATKVKVVLIKPGPTATPMTAHLSAPGGKFATAEQVALAITTGIQRGKTLIYTPAKWALIMMIIRHLPRFVFNKMDI